MVNGQKIMDALSETGALTGANGFSGASDEIGRAARAIGSVRDYDETLGQLSDTLLDIESLMGDFNRGLSDYMDQFTFDEQELRRIEERLDLINRFKTKYGNTIEKIIEAGRQKRERLEVLSNYEAYLCNLKAEYEKKEKELKKTANEISKIRKSYAKQLSAKIT